jgi:glucose/arabinose dehydrogenase
MPARPALAAVLVASLLAIGPTSAASPTTAPAAYVPGAVTIGFEPFADGFDQPVFVTPDGTGDGLLYVVEQTGVVRVLSPDGTVAADPFLDLRDRVLSGGEQGLLGLAFHPDFAHNGRLFVYYTAQDGDSQVLAEFHAIDGVVDASSQREILRMADPANNHNGGMLAFDHDGMLLIATGDGGGGGDPFGNGQDVTQLLGKLLRIDVDGGDPYGLPVNDPDGLLGPEARGEIRATGLRNPWRFSVDRLTGDVFIGDVGQGTWEEVNVLPVGQGGWNYGWSVMEGPGCFEAETCDMTGLTMPVVAYGRDVGSTIIGGFVYRGTAYPGLEGAYVFGDFGSGQVWALAAADAVATGRAAYEAVGSFDGSLASFGQDDAGELYAVDLGGRILRVTAAPR